jgi:hypothetical protein
LFPPYCRRKHINGHLLKSRTLAESPRSFAVAGGITQSNAWRGSLHLIAGFEFNPRIKFKQVPTGFLFEGGYVGPFNNLGSGSALFSADYAGAYFLGKSNRCKLFFAGGYTRLFGTGNAVNYGGGVDFWPNELGAVRFELRDYLRISGPKEHNVAFRVGYALYMFGG